MGALEPAAVPIPSGVHSAAIINRSVPSENNSVLDKIDKIVSAEGLNLDAKGAEATIAALHTELERDTRFEAVKVLENGADVRKGLGVWPATLSWETIDMLCEHNNVDLIFSLAFYDTDTKVDYSMTTMQLPNALGVKVSVPAHEVKLNTQIKKGWRIYDAKNRRILDEFTFREGIHSAGKGINPVKALEAIANRNETVVQYSKNMGSAYGLRLQPQKRRISRNYFVRGSDKFVMAKRRAQTGDWDGAAKLWEMELTNSKPKIAGRACYNMAIINEINGNLPEAIDWASKSYADYENKDALRYLNILKYRFAQNEVLEQQQASR
tara:strand:+ start:106253 stop:107224 length:972 start_codon:yes stop_codon:yes gene_type:complete